MTRWSAPATMMASALRHRRRRGSRLALALIAALLSALAPQSLVAHPPTIVSLTFDDGDEIGGHSIDHVDLAAVDDAAARKAVCDDLRQLRKWYGDRVWSFAYPFASVGPHTRGLLAVGCPGTYGPRHQPLGRYESARTVGQPDACADCPSDPLPPDDRYFLPSNESVVAKDTLADLKSQVLRAEARGGWLTLVFHKICDDCDEYSVRRETLVRFLFWLKQRTARGPGC